MVDPAASQFQPVVCLKRCCGHSTQARNGTCYRKAIVRPTITGSAWCSCACEAKPENLIGDRAYDSDPLDEELRKGRHRNDRAAPVQPNQAAQSGSAAPEPLYATVARRAFLRLDTVAASHPRPLGVPRPELPRLCPARLPPPSNPDPQSGQKGVLVGPFLRNDRQSAMRTNVGASSCCYMAR